MKTPDIIVITGTDTDVGKTVVTAAVAALLTTSLDRPVAVHKLVQTGVTGEGYGDAAAVSTLTWAAGEVTCTEGMRLAAPMAPVPAAALESRRLLNVSEHAGHVAHLGQTSCVVAEGSGGLLVPLDRKGGTIGDLHGAIQQIDAGLKVATIVVCRAALGTLNHTALTLEALERRGGDVLGLVIGAWPQDATDVHRSNVVQLQDMAPILGAIPQGQGSVPSEVFVAQTRRWLPGLAELLELAVVPEPLEG